MLLTGCIVSILVLNWVLAGIYTTCHARESYVAWPRFWIPKPPPDPRDSLWRMLIAWPQYWRKRWYGRRLDWRGRHRPLFAIEFDGPRPLNHIYLIEQEKGGGKKVLEVLIIEYRRVRGEIEYLIAPPREHSRAPHGYFIGDRVWRPEGEMTPIIGVTTIVDCDGTVGAIKLLGTVESPN